MELAKRTISLTAKHNTYIERKLKSGEYASATEVVREGLRALQERDEAVDHWLKNDVAKTYDAMKADPTRGIPSKRALEILQARRKKFEKA